MKTSHITALIFLFVLCNFTSCQQNSTSEQKQTPEKETVEFNEEIAKELARRAEVDQIAAWIPQGKFKEYSKEEWKAYKDSVFQANKAYLETILDEYGFPGFDLVGEAGSNDFWLMTQHCDFDPDFQQEVLAKMKIEIDRDNANKSNYAYLLDRIQMNTGQKLRYGTQVQYNPETGQAMSLPLEDSVNVNLRRQEVGLEPLEEYLNDMTISHFEMNKAYMLERGITVPSLYEVKE